MQCLRESTRGLSWAAGRFLGLSRFAGGGPAVYSQLCYFWRQRRLLLLLSVDAAYPARSYIAKRCGYRQRYYMLWLRAVGDEASLKAHSTAKTTLYRYLRSSYFAGLRASPDP